MTREEAESRRHRCIQSVKDAQARCAKAIGQDRERAKAELQVRLQELAIHLSGWHRRARLVTKIGESAVRAAVSHHYPKAAQVLSITGYREQSARRIVL